jgi:hypothetical protein
MGMTKDELEFHHHQYFALLDEANAFVRQGDYINALQSAASSFDHIDGMMQYKRRYDSKDPIHIETIGIVLKLSPLLFESQIVTRLETLLRTEKRIGKNSAGNLAGQLLDASALMEDARRLWNQVEKHPNCEQDQLPQDLGGRQERWQHIAEFWSQIGLISRVCQGNSISLTLATRMDEPVMAKCPFCGSIVKAIKTILLDEAPCPHCHKSVVFVLLTSPDANLN